MATSNPQFRQCLITSYEDSEPQFIADQMEYLNYQQEICPNTQRLHWQIYVQFKKRLRLTQVKAIFGATVHVDVVHVDNGASRYCLKDATAVEGTRREFGTYRASGRGGGQRLTTNQITECNSWQEVLALPNVGFQLNWAREVWHTRPVSIDTVTDLRPWQQEEFTGLQAQDERTVRFIVDFEGGQGKTKLAQYMAKHLQAFYCTGGKTADIMHAFQDQEYVVFDLARCTSQEYWPYQTMEFFKNGMGFACKYASASRVFKPCKIIVFCNQEPDRSRLSDDRFSVRYLTQLRNITN